MVKSQGTHPYTFSHHTYKVNGSSTRISIVSQRIVCHIVCVIVLLWYGVEERSEVLDWMPCGLWSHIHVLSNVRKGASFRQTRRYVVQARTGLGGSKYIKGMW